MANDDQARMVESLTDDMIKVLRDHLSNALGPETGAVAHDEIAAMFRKTLDAMQEDVRKLLQRR